jgi:hypothetical protein
MFRKAIRQIWILGVLLAIPAFLRGGVNTWTGGDATSAAETFSVVAADPTDPYVVYGSFGHDLHRSRDGGRTWERLRSFGPISAILVLPASPSTIYAVGYDAFGSSGVFRSTDSGDNWTNVLEAPVYSLASSPTDASVVFAGGWSRIYKSTDSGDHWSFVSFQGVITSLVINPKNPSTLYAGADADLSYGYFWGAFGKSEDGGASWSNLTPATVRSVPALGIDAGASATLYAARFQTGAPAGADPVFAEPTVPWSVVRSEDGGVTWSLPGTGLPEVKVQSLATDPRISGTLYAGTDVGVYRSRDGGRSWTPFGLAGLPIISLAIDGNGTRLHAGTSTLGIYDFEIASGPLDLAAGPAGGSRFLSWNTDRLSVAALDASGHSTVGPTSDASETWRATAIASDGGDRAHVLWHCTDGRSALEIVGRSGRESVKVFAAEAGWMPGDVSVRSGGKTSLLWTHADGRMRIATIDSSGGAVVGPEYGPAFGWSAVAIADDFAGTTRVLWRSSDGRSSLSLHRDGEMLSFLGWPADPGWSVEDIAVGADGRTRLLRTSPDDSAEVSIVEPDGTRTSPTTYASPGFTPRRIAAGADGLTRLLFSGDEGSGDLVVLAADNTLTARHAIPSANAATVVVTTVSELEAALVPANAGAQIVVRAGDYEIANPLTVPDRAILAGEGVMTLDESKLPAGIAPSGRTVIRAAAGLAGDILTLGNGSVIRSLVIEDAEGRAAGNPVAVVSRDAGDRVTARILDCEIVNPNPSGIAPQGPTGRGLVVWTRNPNLGEDPPPHEGARLRVQMTRSIVRSPAAAIGVFSINFASHAAIDLDLDGCVIGGGLTTAGGVSRPDAVTGAVLNVASRRNLYRSDSPDPTPQGWNLQGGTSAPIPGLASQASTSNTLRVHSRDDRIEGFANGIFATGATRSNPLSEPSSSNGIDLTLQGLRLQTAAADLTLFGATTFVEGVSAGDDNGVRVVMRQSTGSGARANVYANSAGDLGTGNRLEFAGSATAFAQTNEAIDPAPPAEFFTSGN